MNKALLLALTKMRGLELLGVLAIDEQTTELVFEEVDARANLITVWSSGKVAVGFVVRPEEYVA